MLTMNSCVQSLAQHAAVKSIASALDIPATDVAKDLLQPMGKVNALSLFGLPIRASGVLEK